MLSPLVSKLSSFFAGSILVVSFISLNFFHYQSLNRDIEEIDPQESSDQKIIQQELSLLRSLPKFGYTNLFADWTLLNFIQYFGDSSLRQVTGYGLSDDYFESIIDSDPLFIESYIFLVNSISMYMGQPENSIRLIEMGLEDMAPDKPERSYLLWRYKGTDELLFLGDTLAAQQSYQTAAAWAEKSSDENAELIAKLSKNTANFLAEDPNSRPAQINSWSEVLLRAIDDNIRQKAIAEIEALGGKVLRANDGQVTIRYGTEQE